MDETAHTARSVDDPNKKLDCIINRKGEVTCDLSHKTEEGEVVVARKVYDASKMLKGEKPYIQAKIEDGRNFVKDGITPNEIDSIVGDNIKEFVKNRIRREIDEKNLRK